MEQCFILICYLSLFSPKLAEIVILYVLVLYSSSFSSVPTSFFSASRSPWKIFEFQSKQMIEILCFLFPQCKDIDRSKIAEKAIKVDLFRHSNSGFTIKFGRMPQLVSFSKVFFLCESFSF